MALSRSARWQPLLGTIWILTPAVAQADDAVTLRYGWESGARFAYEVEIVADKGDAIETLKGTPILKVEAVGDDGATVTLQNKTLASTTKSQRPTRGFRIPAPPRIPRGGPFGRGFTGHEMTLDSQGRVVTQRGDSQLPFVLGNLAQLLVEPFPAEAKPEWSHTASTTIRITSDWPPRSPFREDVEQERLNAEERTDFTLKEVTPESATLEKRYRLATIETVDDEPRMELTGRGTITFDRRRKIISGLEYEAAFVMRERNTEKTYPITITFRLLSDEELAEHDARVAQAAAERKAPPSAELREQHLADLGSEDVNRARTALVAMSGREPDAPDAELAAAFAIWLASDDRSIRSLTAKNLELWATEAEVSALLKAMDDEFQIVANSAMIALGRLQAEEAVEPLAEKLGELASRLSASAALKQIGASAEAAVVGQLDAGDWQTRMEALRVLQEIGTKDSLEALRKASAEDKNILNRQTAGAVIKRIEAAE